MADLTISAADITQALKDNLAGWEPSVTQETVGYVSAVADGVAKVTGLPNAMASELLEFSGGLLGVALNLDEDEIGVVLLGDASHIEEGSVVKATGDVLSVPVGDGMLGRVVNALGDPIDGKGPIEAAERRLLPSDHRQQAPRSRGSGGRNGSMRTSERSMCPQAPGRAALQDVPALWR